MEQNDALEPLTSKELKAVELFAQGSCTDTQIGDALGVSRSTVGRWKRKPAFQEALQAAQSAIVSELRAVAIGIQQDRIDELDERWRLLKQVRRARAADPFYADAPGGDTGLVLKQLKTVKHTYDADPNDTESKPSTQIIEVWETQIDAAYLREIRELEKQAAQELGQWISRSDSKASITVEMDEAADMIARKTGLDKATILAKANELMLLGGE